jgi:hypothetical protein
MRRGQPNSTPKHFDRVGLSVVPLNAYTRGASRAARNHLISIIDQSGVGAIRLACVRALVHDG